MLPIFKFGRRPKAAIFANWKSRRAMGMRGCDVRQELLSQGPPVRTASRQQGSSSGLAAGLARDTFLSTRSRAAKSGCVPISRPTGLDSLAEHGSLQFAGQKAGLGHVAPRHRFRLDIGREWSVVRVMRTRPKNDAQPILPEAIAAQVERLAELPPKGLREAWAAQFRREPPKGLWADLLL